MRAMGTLRPVCARVRSRLASKRPGDRAPAEGLVTTVYAFRKGFLVRHTRREDGLHDIEVSHGSLRSSGTYRSIECLDVALDAIAMAVGAWVSCSRKDEP